MNGNSGLGGLLKGIRTGDTDVRKWFAFLLLIIGLIPFVFIRAESVYSGDYTPFCFLSLELLLVSTLLAHNSGWKFNRSGSHNLLDFLRFFLLRYFVGESLTSLYGLFIFVLFAVTLTAWLPDGFENGNLGFILGSVFYFLSSVFLTAWVYGPPEGHVKGAVEYLVYPMSIPNWDIRGLTVSDITCRALCINEEFPGRNGRNVRVNAAPLFTYLKKYPSIKMIVLLVTDQVVLGASWARFPGIRSEEGWRYVEKLFEVFGKCLNRKFKLVREDLERIFLDGEEIPTENEEVTVRFVQIGDPTDIKNIKNTLREAFKRLNLEDRSSRVLIDITGGTAPMSAALILEAIKGDYRAGYVSLPQDTLKENGDCPVVSHVREIDLTIFEFDDLLNELKRNFERTYMRRRRNE